MRLVAVSLSLLAFGAVTNNVVVVQGYVVAPAAVRFFATSSTVSTRMRMTNEHHHTTTNDDSPSPADLDIILSNNQNNQNWATTLATTATTTALLWPSAAVAAGPDWGLFEGRIGSLLHPLTMGSLFVFSLYTAFLGWQWRRQRTLGDEISSLKQQQTSSSSSSSSSGGDDMAVAAVLSETRALSNLDLQIQALQNERKQLAASGPRDKHFSQGALLACVGTLFAIEASCWYSVLLYGCNTSAIAVDSDRVSQFVSRSHLSPFLTIILHFFLFHHYLFLYDLLYYSRDP